MDKTTLDANMQVDEIMRRWPAAIRPFLYHRMLCVGCPIGVFHTVADACVEHGLNEEIFKAALLEAIEHVADAEPDAVASAVVAGPDQPPTERRGP